LLEPVSRGRAEKFHRKFFGWFVLMGKNGIRIGDWVEINGVTGEVIEFGMFHAVLLETGNGNMRRTPLSGF
jgi:small-conductance mechanosensitive channel